jgi:hypothetical protein
MSIKQTSQPRIVWPKLSTETDLLIADFFRVKLAVSTSCPHSIVLHIHEWWFVPRSEDAFRDKTVRLQKAATYLKKGTLPPWCRDAYSYATGDACKEHEALIASYRAT